MTVPTAPLLKETELLAAVGLKAWPAMVIVAALAASDAVLVVTTGRNSCNLYGCTTADTVGGDNRCQVTGYRGIGCKVDGERGRCGSADGTPTAPLLMTTTLLPVS